MKRRAVIGFISLALVITFVLSVIKINRTAVPCVSKLNQAYEPIIILDAGHGGVDGGATGTKAVEKHLNLDITLKLADMLKMCGYDVVLTRTDDSSIHDPTAHTISEMKTSDLKNRRKIAEKYKNAFFFSIHQNHFSQSKYKGAQMFYGPQNSESKFVAQFIQDRIRTNLQNDNKRNIKPATDDLYLLYNLKCPSVLIECGFLSNPNEEALLLDDEYRCKMAFSICSAICEYFDDKTLIGCDNLV